MFRLSSNRDRSPLLEAQGASVVAPGPARPRAFVALGALVLSVWVAPASASTQLSAGLPFSDIDFSSTPPRVSPDGQYAVYRQDAVIDGAAELWSVPLSGDAGPVRLSDVLSPGQFLTFAISPDSSRVVYTVDQDIAGRIELFSVPIAGGVVTKLNPSLGANRNVLNFRIAPTANRVFYLADVAADDVYQLYSVPILGGTSVRINADLPPTDDVEEYLASPDGNMVVYRAGPAGVGGWELWSVPATGPPEAAVKISRALTSGGAVDAYFQISPNGTRAVYRADATLLQSYNLYSVPIGGGTSTQLNGTLATNEDVAADFLISANSSRVAYRSDEGSNDIDELYSVPLAGGLPTRLNASLASGGDVLNHAISPDSARVVYRADQDIDTVDELYSVPVAGGTPIKLNGALVNSGDVLGSPTYSDFLISPDSQRVVYLADQNVDTLNELFSVPIGGGTVTRLNRTLTSGGDVQTFLISPDSEFVVYGADQDLDTFDELLALPIVGGSVLDVNGPLVSGGDVVLTSLGLPAFAISADSLDVLYAADENVNDEIELYVSNLTGPPGPPTDVVATPGNAQATVTFSPPASDGGSPITGYTVTPSPLTVGWVDNNAGSTALTHVISNLTNGTAYTFTVRATNVYGTGVPSVPSNVATPATVPGPPTAVVATGWHQSATVAFAAPASNGGSAITGYAVTSDPAGGIDTHAGTSGLNHYIVGLTNGVLYTFTVVASNAAGAGLPSAPSNTVTPACDLFCDGFESGGTSAWITQP